MTARIRPESPELRIGIAGLGRIGRIHFANFQQHVAGATVVAAADPSPEARSFVPAHGVEAYATFEELLEHDAPDAVVIGTPTDFHADYVMVAAKRGLHVFCEKPLDLTVEKVRATLAVVEQAGVQLMLGFNRRFDPNFVKVKEIVASGQVGEPHLIRITSRDPAPPPLEYLRHSGGLFLDMTIHDFDMARFLGGEEIVEVYARGANLLDPAIGETGDIDTAVCLLSFASGATAIIDNSRQAVYGYDQRVEVFGSKGSVSVGNETPDRHCLATAKGVRGPLPEPFFLERYATAYRREAEAFVEAIREKRQVPVSGRDGLMALMLGLAANKSLETHRPIPLENCQ